MSHAIVQAARGWIGTPYVHQASVKGGGTDCLGLVRGIWREFFGADWDQFDGIEGRQTAWLLGLAGAGLVKGFHEVHVRTFSDNRRFNVGLCN